MKRFTKVLTVFMSALPIFTAKANASPSIALETLDSDSLKPVSLRALNTEADNKYAAHRSHSSHSSHRSHRSSSGGGYTAPKSAPSPNYTPPTPSRNQSTDPGRSATVSPSSSSSSGASPTGDKLTIQVMRVQIALSSKSLFFGTVDGVLGPDTRNAIQTFQASKGLKVNGRMTTETLNALGVPAQ